MPNKQSLHEKIVIWGGGESGVGAALLAKQKGYEVFLFDEGSLKKGYRDELENAGILFSENRLEEEKAMAADIIIKSPGIAEKHGLLKKLRAAGKTVMGEIELAYRYKEDSKIIAITGSNGKTTTTALMYHICKTAGLDAALVGNIGYSFARQVAEDPKPLYVLEISSFQLDDIIAFRPDVAILLNITEDHLDRYEYKMENYIRSKLRIAMNQTEEDVLIYNHDDDNIMGFLKSSNLKSKPIPISMKQQLKNGAFVLNDEMHIHTDSDQQSMSVYDFALKGKHNQFNTMAASVAGATMDIRKNKIREAVQTFQALEHRMEAVATVRGVEFINDSKATNVNSTWYALESMNKPTVLILGGVDKGNDYGLLKELVTEKVKAIVCMGIDNKKIHDAFSKEGFAVVDASGAKEAVEAAYKLAAPGDVVLLSPACASFDLFKNYEDRGTQFKEAVKSL